MFLLRGLRGVGSCLPVVVGPVSGGEGRLLPGLLRLLLLFQFLFLAAEGGVGVGGEVVGNGLPGRAGGPGTGGDVGGAATAGLLGRRPRRPLGGLRRGGCLRAGGGFAVARGLATVVPGHGYLSFANAYLFIFSLLEILFPYWSCDSFVILSFTSASYQLVDLVVICFIF